MPANGVFKKLTVLGKIDLVPQTDDLILRTQTDSKTVKINSRNYRQATGDSIGSQSKPAQTVTTSGDVFGSQVSPRVSDAVGCGSLVGVQGAPIIKGSGTVTGTVNNVKCFAAELTDETPSTATKVFTADLVGYHARGVAMAAGHTYSGHVVPFKVGNHENAKAWDAFLKLDAALGTHSCTTSDDKTGNGKSGTLKVYAVSTLFHIQLYANA